MRLYEDTLFDEENEETDLQDYWEGASRTGNIEDELHESHEMMGAPAFEVKEWIDHLLSEALSRDENILIRRYFGLGCRPSTVEELAALKGISARSMESMLREALRRIREHDEAIYLWKYLYR